ncbi:MAG: PQQ-dependent sugar dehydrogenase [Opitutaceae bacterium]|nr:PQQ-dependent sugar dehydrogenase [Opitutaceae bacterium]
MKFLVAAITLIALLPSGFGESRRSPWMSSKVAGSPEPPKAFVQEAILPELKFVEGLELAPVSGTGRLLMVERRGKISSFDPRDGTKPVHLLVDLLALHPDLEHAFGVALHPKYRDTREIFVCYALTSGRKDGTKLSRFKLSSLDPLVVDPSSEEVLLTWLSGEHNGANLQFGPDGYLYVTTGDGAPPSPPDLYVTGQDVTDLLASILRIDIDHRDPPLAYRIPPDNPWAKPTPAQGTGGSVVRPEVWAFGLRNPFKMSFDRATGRLWCGDVGWELWEMIHLIKRGGNYGWSAYEAHQPIVVDRLSPLAPITPPVVTHAHSEAASITGGFVYHGRRLPELTGAYVYGDWATGKIWALWYDGSQVTRHEEIADTPHNIVTFGQDDEGEIYYLNYATPTTIHRLIRNPKAAVRAPFPRRLSETGIFADVKAGRPALGVYDFEITRPMWEDGATVESRLIALPAETKLTTAVSSYRDTRINKMVIDYYTRWPAGAVLARTITLGAMALTEAERTRRIETQVLHFDGEAWNAYSYRWNETGTDADLVAANGEETTLRVRPDPQALDQDSRLYRWRFQSRAECLRCHNSWNNGALAFTAAQLRPVPGPQSQRLVSLALIDTDFLEQNRVPLEREDTGLWAARSVLHANCAHCHRSDAGGAVTVYLNTELLAAQMNAVGVAPSQGGLGLKDPLLIAPGDPWSSVLCVRMAKSGHAHMPIIGARETDVAGLKTLEDWIARMTSDRQVPKPWTETVWTTALIDEALATVNGAMRLRRAIDDGKLSVELRRHAFQAAWASPEPTIRDVYERFKPDHLRERTLGAEVNPAEVLALPGQPSRGAALLATEGKLGSCQACHFIRGQGRHFGPDLSQVGARQTAAQILDSILHPSATLPPAYRSVVLELKDGGTQMGFILERRADALALKIATGQTVTVPLDSIRAETALPVSIMPEGLLQGLTPQEAADLIAYLSSLK